MKKIQLLFSLFSGARHVPSRSSHDPNGTIEKRQPGRCGPGTCRAPLYLFFAFLASLPLCARSQTNFLISSNRYLLIVETSRSMEQRGEGTLKAIQQLLMSAMSGQFRYGDSLGIWTYNAKLNSGRFPLQHWSPETHRSTVQNALAFVQAQVCEKQGNLNVVFPSMLQVAQNSQFVTFIIFSDAEQNMVGTPFDKEINKLYAAWRSEQQKLKMPIITILRARSGKFIDFSVNAAPWPVELPRLPKDVDIAEMKPPPPSETPKPKQQALPPRLPNLIISGRKTDQQKISSPTNSGLISNLTSQTAFSSNAAQDKATTSSQITRDQPATSQQLVSGSAKTIPQVIITETSNSAAPVQNAQTGSSIDGGRLSSPPAVQAASVAPSLLGQSVPSKSASEPTEAKTNPDPPTSPLAGSASAQNISAQHPSETKTEVVPGEPRKTQTAKASSSPPITTAVTQRSSLDRSGTLMVVGVIIILAGVLGIVWLRRARTAKHISLITRSLDQK